MGSRLYRLDWRQSGGEGVVRWFQHPSLKIETYKFIIHGGGERLVDQEKTACVSVIVSGQ